MLFRQLWVIGKPARNWGGWTRGVFSTGHPSQWFLKFLHRQPTLGVSGAGVILKENATSRTLPHILPVAGIRSGPDNWPCTCELKIRLAVVHRFLGDD